MDKVANKERDNERQIVTQLYTSQAQCNMTVFNKEMNLRMKQERALRRAAQVEEQNARQREEEAKTKEKRELDVVNKMRQLEVKRNEA